MLKSRVTKSKLGVLAPSQLQRYRQELAERAHSGYPSCFTNLWALINEALLHGQVPGAGLGGGWAPAPEAKGLRAPSFPSPGNISSRTNGRP